MVKECDEVQAVLAKQCCLFHIDRFVLNDISHLLTWKLFYSLMGFCTYAFYVDPVQF